MSEQSAPTEQTDPNELVTIARAGGGEDAKGPGPTATCTREAYDDLYRDRGYGLVATSGQNAGQWAEEPLPEDATAAGSPAASGTVSTNKGA